jgi:hypothetical protein
VGLADVVALLAGTAFVPADVGLVGASALVVACKLLVGLIASTPDDVLILFIVRFYVSTYRL